MRNRIRRSKSSSSSKSSGTIGTTGIAGADSAFSSNRGFSDLLRSPAETTTDFWREDRRADLGSVSRSGGPVARLIRFAQSLKRGGEEPVKGNFCNDDEDFASFSRRLPVHSTPNDQPQRPPRPARRTSFGERDKRVWRALARPERRRARPGDERLPIPSAQIITPVGGEPRLDRLLLKG